MDTPSPSTQDLARRLLAASQSASGPHIPDGAAVIETLRISLAKFAGAAGFVSLLRRAVALAGAELPALQSVKIDENGRLDGAGSAISALGDEATVAITAHLLALLVVFVGEPPTLRLLSQTWPDTQITYKHPEAAQ